MPWCVCSARSVRSGSGVGTTTSTTAPDVIDPSLCCVAADGNAEVDGFTHVLPSQPHRPLDAVDEGVCSLPATGAGAGAGAASLRAGDVVIECRVVPVATSGGSTDRSGHGDVSSGDSCGAATRPSPAADDGDGECDSDGQWREVEWDDDLSCYVFELPERGADGTAKQLCAGDVEVRARRRETLTRTAVPA